VDACEDIGESNGVGAGCDSVSDGAGCVSADESNGDGAGCDSGSEGDGCDADADANGSGVAGVADERDSAWAPNEPGAGRSAVSVGRGTVGPAPSYPR
jgi:hypothetical protein